MSLKTQDQLLAELTDRVRSGGSGGKTTAQDLREFLTSLINELIVRTNPQLSKFRGLYEPGYYSPGEFVLVDGVLWLCKQTTDTAPHEGVNWTAITPKVLTSQLAASFTLSAEHAGQVLGVNSATDVNATVPDDASLNLPVGTLLEICQEGAGQVTVVPAAGVTLYEADGKYKTAKQWASVSLRKRAANEWVLTGYTA